MRRRERPGKKQLYASAGVHVVAVILVWGIQVSKVDLSEFAPIQITLVSPPSIVEAPEPQPVVEEEIVVETPAPVLDEAPDPVIEDTPVEERPEPTPTPTPPPPDPEPVEEAGDPEPAEELSGEDLNIRMEGLERDYPVYYTNIIRQIRRCFEPGAGGRLETIVVFYISRDGTVDMNDFQFFSQSGNINYDIQAMGAVECAGGGRFGPLPEEMGLDRLPVLFKFEVGTNDRDGDIQ
jgi:hypothetical protein